MLVWCTIYYSCAGGDSHLEMLSYVSKIGQLSVLRVLKQDGVPVIKSSSLTNCNFSTMTRVPSLISEKDKRPQSGGTHYFLPSRSGHVVRCRDKDGNFIDSKHVTERFMRLGNGIWLKRHREYEEPSFFKIAKRGTKYIYKTQRHIMCAGWMVNNLDKLVTHKFKKHRWTVTDPYVGYDETAKFYYNPVDMPGINQGKRGEKRTRSWVRFQEHLKLSSATKRRHLRDPGQSNRQKPIPKNRLFH